MSLIETVIGVMLGLVVTIGVFSFNSRHSFAMQDQLRQLDVQSAARSVVDLFAREVRRAGANPTCTGAFEAIATAKADEIQLRSDLDGSGAIDQPHEDVRYRWRVTDQILERTAGQTDLLLSGQELTGSRFRYFDGAGTELMPGAGLDAAQRASVRRVRIEVALRERPADPDMGGSLTASASTDIDLRNRFFVASTGCP
ncbi:MAG: PilW family protein [Candidatus Binatia bacterium]